MNFLKFESAKLSVEKISDLVVAPSCGALSIFVGTTRDNFEDKTVVTLEYEAYESMALKTMEKICADIRNKWKSVENIAIFHRLGEVPVKEASIVIAISSPHREDAIKATEWCINTVKTTVAIWKKEIYKESKPEWKENKELKPKRCIISNKNLKRPIEQEVQTPYVSTHLIQIKATKDEINKRIEKFMERKREEIDNSNIREFCTSDRHSEFTCARVDAELHKRTDSKSHLQVNKVFNSYHHRDQKTSDYLKKYIPSNGIEERLENLETQLSLYTPVPKNVYKRLKCLEERLLYLEGLSPEYIQLWDKGALSSKAVKKKIFSIEEIDGFIADLEKKTTTIDR